MQPLIRALAVALGGIVLLCSCGDKPNDSGQPTQITLERTPLNGADLQELLGILAFKFKVQAPDQLLLCHFWAERYTKGDPTPEIIRLPSAGTSFRNSEVFFNLPKNSTDYLRFITSRGSTEQEALGPLAFERGGHSLVGKLSFSPNETAMLMQTFRGEGYAAVFPPGPEDIKRMINQCDQCVLFFLHFSSGNKWRKIEDIRIKVFPD